MYFTKAYYFKYFACSTKSQITLDFNALDAHHQMICVFSEYSTIYFISHVKMKPLRLAEHAISTRILCTYPRCVKAYISILIRKSTAILYWGYGVWWCSSQNIWTLAYWLTLYNIHSLSDYLLFVCGMPMSHIITFPLYAFTFSNSKTTR